MWTAVFTGVAAAFVGFATATFGYWLTRRDDRRDAAQRASLERIGVVQAAVYGDSARNRAAVASHRLWSAESGASIGGILWGRTWP
jgi:hypothetical protein